ncbi:MAG: hypothetical protein KDJ47_11570 [Hyphomicrobiaceae bacterium]|nr:hypothetical protein [Hyphomicrobiaceae bacterium]
MEPKIIVMIVTLAMPNGDSGVHVKPMPTVDRCVAEANIEASDPFVRHVECSELENGKLLLNFRFENGGAEGAVGTGSTRPKRPGFAS